MALRITADLVKFKSLKAKLGTPLYATLGILETLWHFTAKNAIQGDVGKYTNQEIAAWVEWNGNPDALIEALTETKWLDRHSICRLIVHDWHIHADKSVKTTLRNRKLDFIYAENLPEVPKGITGHPEIPIGVPDKYGAGAEYGAGAGAESPPTRAENPFERPPPKVVFVNPIARFSEEVQKEAREAHDIWYFWSNGTTPNLHKESVQKDLNRFASAAEAHPARVLKSVREFIAKPSPGFVRDAPAWKLLKQLGFDAEFQPRPQANTQADDYISPEQRKFDADLAKIAAAKEAAKAGKHAS